MITILSSMAEPSKKEALPAKQSEEARAYLVKVIAGGVEEDEFALNLNGVTTIGRKFCDIVFPDDGYLSERHVSVSHGPDGFFLRDDGSQGGVFLRAPEGKFIEVSTGDLVRAGKQFLLFSNDERGAVFNHFDAAGNHIKKHALEDKIVVLGREAPDVTLDANDMTLSRRHLAISLKEGKIFIKDLKSVNSTFIKVRSAIKIEPGDIFRAGNQSFRLALDHERARNKIFITSKPRLEAREKLPEPEAPGEVIQQPRVSENEEAVPSKVTGNNILFKNFGKSYPFSPGETICQVAEKNGIKIVAECHAGICGSDPIQIVSGKDNLNPPTSEESGTLEDLCGLKSGEYRLACIVKPMGPVEVEIVTS
jgi:pSer/pThr/pTyr-binding forkhead associated (FHA) protein/ferredoxin